MSGYVPKVGDTVNVALTGKVTRCAALGNFFVNTKSHRLLFVHDDFDIELIEPAREPFRVGEKLTEAMGEPPVGSVIRSEISTTSVWARGVDGLWRLTGRKGGLNWSLFSPPESYTLIHLGAGG